VTDRRIKLRTGRDVHLVELHQSRTYAGLLEGFPHRDLNEEIIRIAVQAAARHVHCLGTVHLIQPVELPVELPPSAREHYRGRAERVRLPGTICTGVLDSYSPARDAEQDASSLVIVWLQEEFALPIDKTALDAIQSLDWNELASDWSW